MELYDHNRIAYSNVLERFKKSNRTSVIHPTGTGKTYIEFKLCEENKNKKICWLSTSEYIYSIQCQSLKEDRYILEALDFYKYSKLMHMDNQEVVSIKADYIILDEFHRCGAKMRGIKVNELLDNNVNAKVSDISATNIRYLDNERNMVDEILDGDVASNITLDEALVIGILPTPKYIITTYKIDIGVYRNKIDKIADTSVKNEAIKNFGNLYAFTLMQDEMNEAIEILRKEKRYNEIIKMKMDIICTYS